MTTVLTTATLRCLHFWLQGGSGALFKRFVIVPLWLPLLTTVFLLWIYFKCFSRTPSLPHSLRGHTLAGVAAKPGCTCDTLIVVVSNIRCQQWDINNIDRSLKALFCLDCYCFLESQKPRGFSSIPEPLVLLPHTFNYKSLAAHLHSR